VRRYPLDAGRYREALASAGFSGALYLVFQDFRQALEGHLAAVLTPEILRFVRQTETRLLADLTDTAQPFAVMAHETLTDLEAEPGGRVPQLRPPDPESLKRRAGIEVPSAAAPLRFSARIRTEATARLGFYTLVAWARRALRRGGSAPGGQGVQALTDALRRIKRETIRALDFHFKNYRENVKFQYLLKLLDAAAVAVTEAVYDQLRLYGEDLTHLAERIEAQGAGRQQVGERLAALAGEADDLHGRLEGLRRTLAADRVEDGGQRPDLGAPEAQSGGRKSGAP